MFLVGIDFKMFDLARSFVGDGLFGQIPVSYTHLDVYKRQGMYFGEKYQDNDKAYDTNMYTRPEIERILKVGFEYAMKRSKHLTVCLLYTSRRAQKHHTGHLHWNFPHIPFR